MARLFFSFDMRDALDFPFIRFPRLQVPHATQISSFRPRSRVHAD